jgi:REP element-mobilizing transposase RayT
MPDHLHLLVEGRREDADFQLFMRNWRKRSTLEVRSGGARTIWQKGYFERVLREEDGTVQVIAYMLMNPVRARLVDSPLDYPHAWSVTTHAALTTE